MPDVRDRQQWYFPLGEWEKCLICVSGRLSDGLIGWTGKYVNISFRIKTPFFHMLWLRLIVSVLLPHFSVYCSFGCPFRFLSPFSVCCDSSCSFWSSSQFFHILRLRWLFAFDMPPVAFRAAGSPFAVPQLSRCWFPCSFSFARFSPPASFFLCLSLGLHFLPWCLLLLVLVVVFFTPASVLPPPVLPCSVWGGFMVLRFLTHSNLWFPSRCGLPLG